MFNQNRTCFLSSNLGKFCLENNSLWKWFKKGNDTKTVKDSFRTQYVIPTGFGNLDIADSK